MDSWDSKLEGAQKHGQKEKSSVGPRPVRHISLKIAVTLLFSILETWDSQEMILRLFYNGFLRF